MVSAADGVLANDTGTGITVTGHTAPSHGTVTVNADGSFTYTPNNNYAGTDSFTYTITDLVGQTATATVNLTVALPAAPAAPDYSESTPFNTPLVISGPDGVLSNATGTSLSATLNTGPADGTVVVNADGAYTYTPNASYAGTDSFTYTVTDLFDRTATGTVTIDISAPGAPTAPDYSESTPFNTPLVISGPDGVLSNATGTGLTLTAQSPAAHGTAALDLSDGSYTYTPNTNYAGTDSFTYTVTDQFHRTAIGTVTISVLAPTPPTAASYTESTAEGTTLTVDATDGVASKDTGTGLTYALTDDPLHGTAVVNADGSYTYTPDADYSGTDSFTYTVTDADNQTASAAPSPSPSSRPHRPS